MNAKLDYSRTNEVIEDPELIVPIKHNFPGNVDKIEIIRPIYNQHGRRIAFLLRVAGVKGEPPSDRTKGTYRMLKPDFWVTCIRLSDIDFPGNGYTFGQPVMTRQLAFNLLQAWLDQNVKK